MCRTDSTRCTSAAKFKICQRIAYRGREEMRHFLARISTANMVRELSLSEKCEQTSTVVSGRCRRLPSWSLVCVESSVDHKEDFRGLAAAIARLWAPIRQGLSISYPRNEWNNSCVSRTLKVSPYCAYCTSNAFLTSLQSFGSYELQGFATLDSTNTTDKRLSSKWVK